MDVSRARDARAGKTHLLRSGPDTVHWGYLDGALNPALTIDAGDRVVIECVSGNPEWMPPSSTGFDILPELRNIHQQIKRGSGNHIFTGPIFVRGAAVGDVLEIRICDIELRQNWGYNLFRAYGRCPTNFHTIASSISSLTASAM
jgi:acetamidase/formamidase